MITARLIFCISYSIDILFLYLKKSKLPCQKELNFCILIAKKERDTHCMMNAHHMMDSHHMMDIHHKLLPFIII